MVASPSPNSYSTWSSGSGGDSVSSSIRVANNSCPEAEPFGEGPLASDDSGDSPPWLVLEDIELFRSLDSLRDSVTDKLVRLIRDKLQAYRSGEEAAPSSQARKAEKDQQSMTFYKDIRKTFDPDTQGRILRNQYPWPTGLVPPQVSGDWLADPQKNKSWPTDCVAGSRAVDALIALIRLLLDRGLDPSKSQRHDLLDQAYHYFGRNRDADFLTKGEFLATLVPGPETDSQEGHHYGHLRFAELLHNKTFVQNVFSNEEFHLFHRSTWREPGDDVQIQLSIEDLVRWSPIEFDGRSPLGDVVRARFGEHGYGENKVPEGTDLLYCEFPGFMYVRYDARKPSQAESARGFKLPVFKDLA